MIIVDFRYSSYEFLSISSKMDTIEMINKMNTNNNVGKVVIGVDSSIKWNDEILRTMIDKYSNVYTIEVPDLSN